MLNVIRFLKNKVLFISVLLLLAAPGLHAEDRDEPLYLTLEESISRALLYNNQVRSSEFAIRKAVWEKRYAWTLLLPSLSFNSGYTWIDDRTFAERDFTRYLPPEIHVPKTVFQEAYYTSLELSMPLFNGSLLNGLSAAHANEQMSRDRSASTKHSMVFQVISSYLNVLRSKDILDLQEAYLDLSRLNYEKAERLYNAGRYSKTEALRWKVDFQQQRSTVTNSNSALRSAIAALGRVINTDMLTTIQTESTIPAPLLEESERLAGKTDEEILNLIRISDEALMKANAALSSSKSGVRISKLLYRNAMASYLPDVSMSYSYAWRENNTIQLDDYSPKTLRINFSLPLFSGFQSFTSVKSTYYDFRSSEENFSDQLKNTRYVLTETVNKIINLRTQRELSKTNVEFNAHNYRIVEQQKEQGLVSNIDFIDAKLNYQRAQLDDISNQYDFISSMVELYYLLGMIDIFME